MKNPVRRATLRAATTAILGATLVVSSVLIGAVFTSSAGASTTPPWEPIGNPPQAGGLTFYNSSGQVITGGNISDNPIAAYIQGNTALQGSATLADFDGYTPTQNGTPVTSPGNWNGFSFGSSNLPSAAPGALGSSSLPVYTGQSYSLSQLTTAFPNTDTSTTDGYAGLYVLRLRTYQHPNTSSTYDSADISVDPNTGAWTLAYSPQATTTTTLETPTPASPQNAGTSVTLTATVADASAPGTVQFESGGSPVGSPQPVTNGTATLTTTALPAGSDSLTAVYAPTTGAAFAGSTSNPVSYVINAPTVPGAPTIGVATPGNTQASVTFTAPASNGGSNITGYTVTATDSTTPANGGQTGTGTTSPITVTGLTNGDSYTFKVTATNGVGTGAASAASNAVTPATAPGAPTIGAATAGQGQASVTFTAPASNGGSAITGYTVTATDSTTPANGGQTGTGAASPITVTGLHNGDTYTFKVTATNAIGTGAASSASNAVTPQATVPGAPTIGAATPGNTQASVTFTAPASNGGSTITGYTVTATDSTTPANGGQTGTGTTSPITVTGLTNGDSYTFTVTATNGVGTGAASAASNAVTPSPGPIPPPPPAGASSSQGASSDSPSGSATAGVSGLTATGDGKGALTVATYSGNPVAGTVSAGTGVYYDVALSSDSAFSSVSITISDLGPGGQSIDWWNGTAWVPFSNQVYNAATHSVTITVNATTSPTAAQLTGTQIAVSSNPAPSTGYWEVASDGGIFAFGGAGFFGSQGGKPLNAPIVGIAATPDAQGYWEVASDGGVFSFGDAKFYGSEGGKPLNKPIVGITATASGNGYWEVASDGGIFAFGDAKFYGSEGGKPLNKPIVGIAVTPTGNGYWEVASDGGIFNFGDAGFFGSQGGKPLNKPIVGIAATSTGNGYWEVASDGGIFNFGDAGFLGSQGGKPLNKPIVGIAGA